jgi:hypothetical protein
MHIQQVKLETDEEDGMGDHGDLPNGQKILQLRKLHEPSQSSEQLNREIEDIRGMMLRSVDTSSRERLSRREEAATTTQQ